MTGVGTAVRDRLLWLRDLLVSLGPVAVLPVAALMAAYWWLQPTPPKRVVLATGPAQSAYEAYGRHYAAALARDGIEVQLLPSEGSSANLELLKNGQADFGFVQGGTATALTADDDDLLTLGSLFVEPVWLFYRTEAARRHHERGQLTTLAQLRGLRVNVGAPGSGVPALMNQLLDANRIDRRSLKLSYLPRTPAAVAFLAGELDVLAFAAAADTPMVQMLLQTPGVQLLDFVQSEAYARRFAYLSPVTLPRGVVELSRDIPPQNVRLVAVTTSMLARADTHPALQQLFAQTAERLHSGAGWFNKAREYPNLRHNEVPLSPEAQRAYNDGPSFLQNHLPFWLANLIQRMGLALGLVLAIAVPLGKVVPPLYTFRVRSRVFRWYGRLRDIEARLDAGQQPVQTLLHELDDVERQVTHVSVPLSYADELYALRTHMGWVRTRLVRAQTPQAQGAAVACAPADQTPAPALEAPPRPPALGSGQGSA